MARLICILCLAAAGLAVLAPAPAMAQPGQEMPEEFDTGNENFPFHAYLNFLGAGEPMVDLFCGQGLSGIWFRERPDGGKSWFDSLEEAGMGAIALDWPGTGRSQEPVNRDLMRALDATVTAAYDTGRGTTPRLAIAHAEGAALLIKTRSFADYISRTAVLIDPIGPQYAQPLEPMSLDEALAAREDSEDELWRRLGFGPEVGRLAEGIDIDLPTATAVFDAYDRDCFPIRPALLQPLLSPIRVRGTARLANWYVLVVRTPAADSAQVAREEALVDWLREAGVIVETMDLSEDPELAGVTGLPWIGELAPAVMDRLVEWYRRAVILAPEPVDLQQGTGS